MSQQNDDIWAVFWARVLIAVTFIAILKACHP